MALKIDNNLYKYNDNTYLIAIKRKNSNGELINIKEYFEADNNKDAIEYKNKLLIDNNIIISKRSKKEKSGELVSKYIYKKEKDYYRIRIKKSKLFPNGISEYVHGDLQLAKQRRDEIISKAKLGQNPTLKYKNMTVAEFVDEFMEKYCYDNLSEVTADGYLDMLNLYIIPKYGNQLINNMDKLGPELQKFITDLKKQTYKNDPTKTISSKYQNSIYNVFNLLLKKAVEWGGLETNPLKNVKAPKIISQKKEIYTLEQMYKILDILLTRKSIKEKVIITIFICSGIRKGEVVGLHIDDVDFERNTIKVSRSVVSTKRKGSTYEKETKTENGKRIIKLPQFVMNLLKIYIYDYRKLQIDKFKKKYGNSYKAPENIFLSRFGKIMHPDTPYKVWSNFRKEFNLKNVTPHGLRHSWCTAEYHENQYLTPKELAVLMGHGSNIKMTDHYTHELDSRLEKSSVIFDKYESKLYNIENNKMNINFEEVATILTGRLYTNINNTYNVLREYYKIEKNIDYNNIQENLLEMKNELMKEDQVLYSKIKMFIELNNNDWKIIEKGKEHFGNEFIINKNIKLEENKKNDYFLEEKTLDFTI